MEHRSERPPQVDPMVIEYWMVPVPTMEMFQGLARALRAAVDQVGALPVLSELGAERLVHAWEAASQRPPEQLLGEHEKAIRPQREEGLGLPMLATRVVAWEVLLQEPHQSSG